MPSNDHVFIQPYSSKLRKEHVNCLSPKLIKIVNCLMYESLDFSSISMTILCWILTICQHNWHNWGHVRKWHSYRFFGMSYPRSMWRMGRSTWNTHTRARRPIWLARVVQHALASGALHQQVYILPAGALGLYVHPTSAADQDRIAPPSRTKRHSTSANG